MPGFHVYPQTSCLSRECSPNVSVVAPSTPAPAPIGLNATPVAGGSSSGGARKCTRQMSADVLPDTRNLFEGMPAAGDEDYMQNLIFEGGASAAGYDPDETQSQDGRGAFTPAAGYDHNQAAFMRDQVGMDLDGFPLDHEFPDDYGQEEEDECDMEVEPLFEDELANQVAGPKPKRKSKRMKAYTVVEDKLLCEYEQQRGEVWGVRAGCRARRGGAVRARGGGSCRECGRTGSGERWTGGCGGMSCSASSRRRRLQGGVERERQGEGKQRPGTMRRVQAWG
ncbi:uncharacterized protein LOC119350806 [Triticum dicoccoides]|uniref:uncharacterized protein LOC119350806 n=1 Tax=Triticum dicoccoides TaxID=85692 RepID=UPI00188EEDF5|nr:uncharacterized protein LOC119350806 [Triticum dicoccoides]